MIPYMPWCCDLKANETVPFDTLSQLELRIGEWETVNKFTLTLYEVTTQTRGDKELHRYNFEALYLTARWKLADTPGELVAAFDWVLTDEENLVYQLIVYRKRDETANQILPHFDSRR